jgi:hypothetical protein
MSINIILFVLLGLCAPAYAQKTAEGFYVSNSNDSITTQIKIPMSLFGSVDLSKLIFKVEVIDSINQTSQKFKPGDIKSFGFVFENINYTFFSQPTITKRNLKFLQPMLLTPATNIYVFKTADQNGRAVGTFYTLEKNDGSYAFLSTGIRNLDNFKEVLKEFYKENLQLQQLIETKFKSRMAIEKDIINIAKAANIL